MSRHFYKQKKCENFPWISGGFHAFLFFGGENLKKQGASIAFFSQKSAMKIVEIAPVFLVTKQWWACYTVTIKATKGEGNMQKNKEGELYGVFDVFGKRFPIYYGFYEEYERESRWNDPVPIYPDFRAEPQYDGEGRPIVTAMQLACESYEGNEDDDRCGRCTHFQPGEALFGVCECAERRESVAPKPRDPHPIDAR